MQPLAAKCNEEFCGATILQLFCAIDDERHMRLVGYFIGNNDIHSSECQAF